MTDRPILRLYDEDGTTLLDETEIRRDTDYLIIVQMYGNNIPNGETRKLTLNAIDRDEKELKQ